MTDDEAEATHRWTYDGGDTKPPHCIDCKASIMSVKKAKRACPGRRPERATKGEP